MAVFSKVKDYLAKSLARKIIAIVLCVVVLGGAATGVILGINSCSKNPDNPNHKVFDNENDPLRFSTLEVDKVFNPFFSTSATDSSVVGMTQLGLISNNDKGEVAYGDDEEVIAKDVKIVHEKEGDTIKTTTYYFVLKNDVKFSNGSYLTMKDVLFNYYVYLDPIYSGSSTMYSTDIVGLKEYRTQTANENEQDRYMEKYQSQARQRRDNFILAYNDIKNNVLPKDQSKLFKDEAQLKEALKKYTEDHKDNTSYANLLADYEKTVQYFDEELESDYNAAVGTYTDLKFYYKDKATGKKIENTEVKLTTDVEMFLYNEGLITWDEKSTNDNPKGRLNYTFGTKENLLKYNAEHTAEEVKKYAINLVRGKWLPNQVDQVMSYWASTSSNLITYLTNDELSKGLGGKTKTYDNISGIKFVNKDADFTFTDDDGNKITYKKPVYNSNGDNKDRDYVIEGNEVLSVTINGVDPKAIWNFGIGIAPMYYYSDEEHIKEFDYEKNFGVEYATSSFMENVVKNPAKNGLPVGAGAYAASKEAGGLCTSATAASVSTDQSSKDAAEFYNKGTIYYERNPYYNMAQNKDENGNYETKKASDGKEYRVAKINKVRYVVRSANNMINSLKASEIDFAEPNATPELVSELNGAQIGNRSIETSGYGYIGINAGKVPSIRIRRAIMHCINTDMCVTYYKTMAKAIKRSMSTTNWAYPEDTIDYYPYIAGNIPKNLLDKDGAGNYKYAVYEEYRTYILNQIKAGKLSQADIESGKAKLSEDQQKEYLTKQIEKDGYTLGGDGVYVKAINGKSHSLKYKFTIAGDTTDHPAYTAMDNAKRILNKAGMSITVKTDANALKLLASGDLTVWAAAWSSTIDPDMYQVYHKDSKATSVLNWGYREILNDASNTYKTEKKIIAELSEKIDLGRKSEDHNVRKPYYEQALDLVMELAVELPTYQRSDLFAYDQNRIDASTFYQNPTSFKGLTSNLTSISLIVK